MKTLKNSTLLLLLCLLPACGRQLVEFSDPETDAGVSGTGVTSSDTDTVGITSTDTLDTDTLGTDTLGTDTLGTGVTDLDGGILDTDTLGTDILDLDGGLPGTDTLGTDTLDTDILDLDGGLLGTDTLDTDTLGTDILDLDSGLLGTDTLSTDTLGTDTLDTDTLDTDTLGTDTLGTDTLGTDTLSTDTLGTGIIDLDGGLLDAGILDAGLDAGILDAGDVPPFVILTNPDDNAIDVSISKRLMATFSEPMDPATLDELSFTLAEGLTLIPGVVSYDVVSATATFIPTSELAFNAIYTATVSTGAEDLLGTPMVDDHVWSFTTSACGQAPVVLGAADDFVVLAGSTVTSTGPTSVTGDLGVSPGTAVIGFPPGAVVGNQHAGDPTAAQGVADLTTAYNDAAGRALCAVTISGNIGGMTLTPGLYKSTSSLEISSGDLTLDAQGDPDAVFIFQVASTLTTTSGRQVILSGGAKSTNIFWQVGTSATLGSTSAFQGTLMADQAITMETGATLNGRVLARIAAVSLDSNTIVKPAL